ncbi:MAG TPA: enoyl-CoA hydratase family protein [Burkholderiales bacterium]|jgi:enoyl-CoA hydratase/carnithine racemase
MAGQMDPRLAAGNRRPLAQYRAQHFGWEVAERVGVVTLDRPERKNPLTFDAYAELRGLFRRLYHADDVRVVVITGAGENFCSGGDVHEIIGPLTQLDMPGLLTFTRMTGEVVKAMRGCPQPIVSAVDGVCAGAGAILAMASDIRFGTARSRTAFLFVRVGLAGADMGACAILPRIVGHGRAAELLYTGRTLGGEEALQWGFFNRLCAPESVLSEARSFAEELARGPTFAHSMTKRCLHQEWSMGLDQAIEAEAQAQAICMQTQDFQRAYRAFAAKQKPVFEGD